MEIKKYFKELNYSYTLGAFPTIELLKSNKKIEIIDVYIHSSFSNDSILNEIKNLIKKDYIVNDKIFNKLSNKENVYVIGIFKKYNDKLDLNSNHLLLDNPSNMGNLGTIIRSSLGFDITNIAIIKPGVDIFDPKVIRSSMGSIFNCNIEYFNSKEDYIKKYNNHIIYPFMLKATKSLSEVQFNKNELSTLAFGNEATGLDDSYLNDNAIIIKHNNKIDSLNVTNAVSIALYEFSKQLNN